MSFSRIKRKYELLDWMRVMGNKMLRIQEMGDRTEEAQETINLMYSKTPLTYFIEKENATCHIYCMLLLYIHNMSFFLLSLSQP